MEKIDYSPVCTKDDNNDPIVGSVQSLCFQWGVSLG